MATTVPNFFPVGNVRLVVLWSKRFMSVRLAQRRDAVKAPGQAGLLEPGECPCVRVRGSFVGAVLS